MIETDRLLLRPWAPADRRPFADMNADPEVMAHFPNTLTRSESDALADRIVHQLSLHGWGLWAVEVPGVTRFAGFVGLAPVPFDASFTPAVEVGWRLARPWWGNGYATEGARAALAQGFDVLGLAEIVSFTTVGNVRSRAVMERIGLTRRAEFDHPRMGPGSPHRRHVLYALERSGWLC